MMQQVFNFTKHPDRENYNTINPKDLSYAQEMQCLFCEHRDIIKGFIVCEYLVDFKCSLKK